MTSTLLVPHEQVLALVRTILASSVATLIASYSNAVHRGMINTRGILADGVGLVEDINDVEDRAREVFTENVPLEGKRDLSPGSAIVEDIEDDSKAVNDPFNG
jgi:hypothetical protein